MSSYVGISPKNPTKYLGPDVSIQSIVVRNRAPTGADIRQGSTGKYYPIGSFWIVSKNPTTGFEGELFYLSKIVANVAFWEEAISGLTSLTGDVGGIVTGTLNNINILGTPGQIVVSGDPATSTFTFSLVGSGTAIDSFIPNSGTSPVVPTDDGEITMVGAGSLTTVGSLNTLTFQLTGLTNHAVLVGAGTTTITKVGPSAVVGAPLISGGATADPSFSTNFVVSDSGAFTALSASISGGGPQSIVRNTSVASDATARSVIATEGSGDIYTLLDGGSSIKSWEYGSVGSNNHFSIQATPSNSIPNMDGMPVLDISQEGVFTIGSLNTNVHNLNTATAVTIGANGAASALTANPVGYISIQINGVPFQIPYYNPV